MTWHFDLTLKYKSLSSLNHFGHLSCTANFSFALWSWKCFDDLSECKFLITFTLPTQPKFHFHYHRLLRLQICQALKPPCRRCRNELFPHLIKSAGVQSSDSRKTSAGQSGRWEQHLGLFKSSPGSDLPPDRHALTAALIHFSRTLG